MNLEVVNCREKRRTPSNPKSQNKFIVRVITLYISKKKSTPKGKLAQSASNSTNTSRGAIQTDLSKPDSPVDGKLLELITIMEANTQMNIINFQVRSIAVYDDLKSTLFSLTSDIKYTQMARQVSYNQWYHNDYQKRLISDEVSYQFSLQKHNIKEVLRSKMVDWMIEVYGNYRTLTGPQTYFRSVNLMDQFLRRTRRAYTDQDLHLIGIGCMYLASKLEDIYHIPLKDFVKRVAHGKYTELEIKQIENEILETFQFNIYFPTHLDYLSLFYFKCFNLNDNPQLQNVYETAIYVLKMSIHDYNMLHYQPTVLAAAALGYSLYEYLSTKLDEGNKNLKLLVVQLQGQTVFKQLYEQLEQLVNVCKIDHGQFTDCFTKIQKLVNDFQVRFPELNNLEKFG